MVGRGLKRSSYAVPTVMIVLFVFLMLTAAGSAEAWDRKQPYPIKVRVSGHRLNDPHSRGPSSVCEDTRFGWRSAAGASTRTILCPKSGFTFAIGMRPFFTQLTGMTKAESKGGEGTYMSLHGHLRVPDENTIWELYTHLRLWDKVTARVEYLPWHWGGAGHVATDGNFAGLILTEGDAVTTDLDITSFTVGADYDVSFGRDLVFGPNADLYITKWHQRLAMAHGPGMDFSETILQPNIGAHVRYEPSNTGYFSWFKPYVAARFGWMSFHSLAMSNWQLGAGLAPPLSRNVDAGVLLGYKQWKLDGTRGNLSADVGVEGLYLDFSLRF